MRAVNVVNMSRNISLGTQVDVAETSLRRLFGLLGKRSLDPGRGLWIKPSSGVHTMGMIFPIDVIGLDKQLRVVRVWRNLRPFRVTCVSLKIHSVLELPAGRAAECLTEVGDQLEIA
jgi:uncharacterized membrane protein (UPF0127 family)